MWTVEKRLEIEATTLFVLLVPESWQDGQSLAKILQ